VGRKLELDQMFSKNAVWFLMYGEVRASADFGVLILISLHPHFFGFSVKQANSSLQDFFSQAFKLNKEAQEGFFVFSLREIKHQSSKGIFFFNVVCSRFEKTQH